MAELVLGRLKFHWKGDWTPSTAFIKDDVVKYGPTAWVCTANHTSGADFDFTKFEQMVQGITWAGEWSAGKYEVNDIVSYGGAIYVCIADHDSGDSTDTSPNSQELWERLVGGLEWEGTYDNSSEYQIGDIVLYGGYTYICTQNSSGGNVPTNTLYWNTLNRGYVQAGDYENSTTYVPGQVVNYGGRSYTCTGTTVGNLPTDNSYWRLFTEGQKWQGTWSASSVDYKIGDIVRYGARSYICKLGHLSQSSYNPENATYWDSFNEGIGWEGTWSASSVDYKIGDIVRYGGRSYTCILGHTSSNPNLPTNATYWELLNKGLDYKGIWNVANPYILDDVVEYSGTAYVCIQAHENGQQPDTATSYWSILAQGDSNSPMTTTGDMIYRNSGGSVVRLPIGPAGSFLTSSGGIPTWGHLTPQNDYYVSPQGDDTNDGRTPTTSWKTIKHACEQTFSLGQCRVNVQAGTYAEQCPIRVGRSVVLEGNGLGAVTVSPDTTNDNGFGVGISDDGSTPNANSYVFHMNNGCRMRNFVFRNFSTGSVIVSLDPGNGPDDTSVWITSQSPYVQNCTSFTPGGTGFKIDGGLHNGGYKSMVANDWTQINSDGIGIHALNDGRTEIVSCFTYYCDIGYLAEGGAKIRGIVGNNSYGEYGAVARGFSQAETPLNGKLRLNDQTINSVTQLGSDVHIFTSYRDSVGNRFFVGHTAPTGTDVTSTFDATASYPFVAKFNSAGSLDWIYTYESNFGAIHSAVELSDRIYCGGAIIDGTQKGFILSISKAGEIQWQKTIGDTTIIEDLTTDGNNLYAVGNHSTTGGAVIKLNPAGIEQWSRTLEYNDSAAANTLSAKTCTFAGTPTTSTDTYAAAGDATAENNLYVASYDSTANQSVVTRLTSTGGYVTSYIYGDVRINKLRLDTGNGDGIYLMAAGYYDAGAVNKNPLAFRISVDGTVSWQSQIADGSEEGEFLDILPFGDDVYACGYINEGTNNNNTGYLARYTSTGTVSWNYKFDNGTNNVVLNGVMLDGVNVICSGIEQGNSVILNVQRDTEGGIGTVSSGSYAYASRSGLTVTNNTVVVKNIENIDSNSLTLGTTDEALTLNQTPTQTRTAVATRAGFAGIGTGVLFTVDELDRSPKEGSVLQIQGDSETYFVIGVSGFIEGDSSDSGIAQIQLDPAIPSNKTPNDQTIVTFREAFSQVRMSGHDFLDIGTGGFADTNYPVIIDADYTQPPSQDRETLAENGGRVFYVTTDQDGNFRVGDYFKVEQATGRATLSSEEFDLAGLNELQLGSITAGKTGATINEFSTDGTFADNSDSAVPTEKATKTYVDTQVSNAITGNTSIQTGEAPLQTKIAVAGTGISTDTIDFEIAGTEIGEFSTSKFSVKPSGTLAAEIAAQYVLIPKGTEAQRPGTPTAGYLRYNTDTNTFEGYNGTQWSGIGGGNPWISKAVGDTGFTAANNDRIFVDTSGGAVTINLPASPNTGDNVRFVDLASTFDTNNLTIGRNSQKIMNLTQDLTVSTEDAAVGLVYTGATYGWKLVENT
jgi:hypothetical protein